MSAVSANVPVRRVPRWVFVPLALFLGMVVFWPWA